MKNQNLSLKIITIAGITALTGCAGLYNNYDLHNPDPVDRVAGLNRKDYIDNITPAPKPVEEKIEVKEPPLPKISDVLTAPTAPKVPSDKTVTISVTDDVQLRDVFIELSRLADIDIEVERGITGGVIFKAKDMPISEVLERITNLAGLRYSVKNGVVRIENDSPYIESYQANFLNIVRKNSGKISTDTKLQGGAGSGGGKGGSGGGSNGSQIDISSDSSGDIWATLEKEINIIVKSSNPPAAAAAPASNAPKAPGAPAPAAAASSASSATDSFVSINKEAGVITVKTTAKGHAKLKKYLDQVKYYYSSEVLIEAKVVEVALNDQFRSGVDWSIMSKNGGLSSTTGTNGVGYVGAPTTALTGDSNLFTLGLKSGDITAAVQMAEIFGTTRTISSPRLLVMNNQQAILSFAQNETYFTVQCSQNAAVVTNGSVTNPSQLNVTSTLNTVPVGVILAVQSSIDNETNEITMNIRPTLSRLTQKTVSDPATTICVANAKAAVLAAGGNPSDVPTIDSGVPQVDVREMDSVLKLKSGEIMVIGGMIDQTNLNTDTGIPWASDIPILGNVFKTVDKSNQAVQTVIFLKATIVPGYGVDGADQNFYNKFNTDPRALKF